ncbi:MAG TPA: hypothetical protein VMU70_02650, partial [Candidatus Tyrphobacter sp.]|nr:hypothetical protein [Candidatus Tyrphobacter sp.]
MKIFFILAFLAAEAVGLYHAYSYFQPPACVHAKPPCAVPLVAFSSRLILTRLLESEILIALAFWSIKTISFRLILGKNKEATILL